MGKTQSGTGFSMQCTIAGVGSILRHGESLTFHSNCVGVQSIPLVFSGCNHMSNDFYYFHLIGKTRFFLKLLSI